MHVTNFGTAIARGLADSFVSRDAAEIPDTRSSPQENQRLEVPRVFLEAGIEGIRTHVHNSYAEPIFNLDEIGIREKEDRVERKVIVPLAVRKQKIFHGIHPGLKHISLVRCIPAGGDQMIPFLASSQLIDVVVRKLKTEGFRISIHFIIKKREKPYMNAVLSNACISTVFLPHIARVRSNPGLTMNQQFF
jgi:hypothetical protein